MSDNDDSKRPLSLGGRPSSRAELRKPIETGQVRQSFPHGRSKTVTVEVRKKRMIGPGSTEAGKTDAALTTAHESAPAARSQPSAAARNSARQLSTDRTRHFADRTGGRVIGRSKARVSGATGPGRCPGIWRPL